MIYKLMLYQFYLITRFIKRNIKNHLFTGELGIDSVLLFSIFEFINLYTLFKFFGFSFLSNYFKYIFLTTVSIIGICNYYFFVKGNKFEQLINSFKNTKKYNNILSKLLILLYILLSCIFFVVFGID